MTGKTAVRAVSLLLLCLTMLAGCGKAVDEQASQTLSEAVSEAASEDRFCADFLMEATFSDPGSGQSGVLYFIDGRASCDRKEQKAFQEFRVTLLGASSHACEYLTPTKKIHVEDDEQFTEEIDASVQEPGDGFLAAFPYSRLTIPTLAQTESLTAPEAGNGLYVLTAREGQKELIEKVWKLDLYTLAGITVPDREKESFGDVVYECLIKNGALSSVTVRLNAVLYQKAGYTPGYTPKDDENRLELSLRVKLSFVSFGREVQIPEYQENS